VEQRVAGSVAREDEHGPAGVERGRAVVGDILGQVRLIARREHDREHLVVAGARVMPIAPKRDARTIRRPVEDQVVSRHTDAFVGDVLRHALAGAEEPDVRVPVAVA